ncbi:MAG: hypothetical protein JOZ17_22445 [Acetobacteraceae bacterium]|nr:hypothetical protein [Acetobacteraceae bacterium]
MPSRDTPGCGDRKSRSSPMLDPEVETALCRRWRDHHDICAAQQLISAHWHVVVETALGYRGFGLSWEELIGEAYAGLMRAVCRFDPDRGTRLATCALWWVRASIHQRILRNFSLAAIETTASRLLNDWGQDAWSACSERDVSLRASGAGRLQWELQDGV